VIRCDGPYTCPFPDPADFEMYDGWDCPGCGARYKLVKPKQPHWRLRWIQPPHVAAMIQATRQFRRSSKTR